MTPRDKKLALALVPLVLIVGYWFVILAPKREEASKAAAQLTKAEESRDAAQANVSRLEAAKADFSKNYKFVLQLGKAIPSSLDMPGLLVQLDKAAAGTGIRFDKVSAGASSGAQGSGSQPPAAPAGNAAAGGAQAQSGPGKAAETAGNTVNDANASSGAAAGQSGSSAPASGASPQAPGLVSVPLDFTFTGNFFDLADFFHQLKRFVRVANDRLVVKGRLMTVDSFNFSSGESFPKLKADVKATVYLVPKQEGATAGATPAGPTSQSPTPTSGGSAPAPTTPPAATVTP